MKTGIKLYSNVKKRRRYNNVWMFVGPIFFSAIHSCFTLFRIVTRRRSNLKQPISNKPT
jgi:hypothetical protein